MGAQSWAKVFSSWKSRPKSIADTLVTRILCLYKTVLYTCALILRVRVWRRYYCWDFVFKETKDFTYLSRLIAHHIHCPQAPTCLLTPQGPHKLKFSELACHASSCLISLTNKMQFLCKTCFPQIFIEPLKSPLKAWESFIWPFRADVSSSLCCHRLLPAPQNSTYCMWLEWFVSWSVFSTQI